MSLGMRVWGVFAVLLLSVLPLAAQDFGQSTETFVSLDNVYQFEWLPDSSGLILSRFSYDDPGESQDYTYYPDTQQLTSIENPSFRQV